MLYYLESFSEVHTAEVVQGKIIYFCWPFSQRIATKMLPKEIYFLVFRFCLRCLWFIQPEQFLTFLLKYFCIPLLFSNTVNVFKVNFCFLLFKCHKICLFPLLKYSINCLKSMATLLTTSHKILRKRSLNTKKKEFINVTLFFSMTLFLH